MSQNYQDQINQQIEQYRDTENMHELPGIFHVWTSDYVLPALNRLFNAPDINSFYVEAFVAACKNNREAPVFLSLGCGDGAVEIEIAKTLRERGISRFRFICYDLSHILLDRFRQALPAELEDCFELIAGDLNSHIFQAKFDAVMANHSLHHIVDLEGIYRTTFDCLTDDGIFVTSDMIGRNGHMRWPEARLFVDFVWPFLTQRQRRNVLLRRQETEFIDHDCSTEGFEGIRSQDVLPLILNQGFYPWKFFGFGGMIDVFVDRCFGPNFDVKNPDDAFFARRIGFLNETLLDAGLVKPTMMLAYFTKTPRNEELYYRNRSARRSVRDADTNPSWLSDALADFARLPVNPNYVFGEGSRHGQQVANLSSQDVSVVHAARANSEALEGSLAKTIEALRHAQDQHIAAQTVIVQQAEQIRAMERSSSWELTAPLRLLSRLFRRH